MSKSKRRSMVWGACLVGGLLIVPVWAQAVDLREGIEQLAVQLGKDVPEQKQLRIAVTDFPDLQEVISDLGRHIAEEMTTLLSQDRRFTVIERRRLRQILGELKFGMSDLVDPNKAKQLGKMVGVEALVTGSISDLGIQVRVNARIIEIETGRILPGVSVTIAKDQTVSAMLESGRMVASESGIDPAPPPIGSPGKTTARVPPRRGIYPVGREFTMGTGQGVGRVHLFNIEIVEGRFLRFNFDFNWGGWTPGHAARVCESRSSGTVCFDRWIGHPHPEGPSGPVDVYLDNSVDTTFLVDDLGRQHPLVQATGIGADRPIRVSRDGSKRFTLSFPFPSTMESFKYQAILLMRIGDKQSRLQIRAEENINLTDFR